MLPAIFFIILFTNLLIAAILRYNVEPVALAGVDASEKHCTAPFRDPVGGGAVENVHASSTCRVTRMSGPVVGF